MKPKQKLKLPTRKTKPKQSINEYSALIYGQKKIGKTTLCSQFDNALMLFFEAGGKALSVYGMPMSCWDDFLQVLTLLETTDHNFETIVVDTVDIAYKQCFKHVCEKVNMEHPGDEGWGKGWAAIADEFTTAINRVLTMNQGAVFISHSVERELKTRSGRKFTRIVPTLPGQASGIINGLVDSIFYYEQIEEGQQLVIEGNELVTAGSRIKGRFVDCITGAKLEAIPMGDTEEEAFANLQKAFNNELTIAPQKTRKRKPLKLPKKRH